MNEYIEHALRSFRAAAPSIARSERYFKGEHNLAFASEKFQNTFGTLFREFAMNLCPAVVDAVCDKLIVTGFTGRDAEATPAAGEAHAPAKLDAIWHDNRMAMRSAEVHREAVKNGDAYVIVWPDAAGRPVIYPNRSDSCTVAYDEESPGRVAWAAKHWRAADKRIRLNLFFADRIEKYISKRPSEGTLPEAVDFAPLTNEPGTSAASIVNPYGIVPVFHFANNAEIDGHGRSELSDAIPIQDGLNKSVLDMLVAMEFSSYRQRWAAGIELDYDSDGNVIAPFKAGIDHVWIAANPEARFGDFDTAQLNQFLKVKDSFRIDIASVTGTPLHYLMPYASEFPSGEALRKAETRFTSKVRARQMSFGQVWSDAMRLALRIDSADDLHLETRWIDPAAVSDRETLENLLHKRQIGLPAERALKEAGY
jgi:hypothetical protein